MTVLPILDDASSSTKDKIINLLVANPILTTKKINNLLKKHYATSITYQAVHKTLKLMVIQGIFKYDNKGYSISQEWIKKLRLFVNKFASIETSKQKFYSNMDYKKLIESPATIRITLKNRQDFDEFYFNIRKHLIQRLSELEKKDRVVFRSFWHLYYPISHPTEENMLITELKKQHAKSYTFVIGDTPLDRWGAKIYKNSPVSVFFGEHIASTNMIFVYGNIVMDVYYDYKTIELFDEVFINAKMLNSLTITQAVNNLYTQKEPIYITLNKDPAIVNMLKKLFFHRLSKHNIYLPSKDYDREFESLHNTPLLNETRKYVLSDKIAMVNRKSHSYILKNRTEEGSIIKRIIVLPPGGFTTDHIDELSCHPEVRYAKLTFKGGIRKYNKGFIKLKKSLKYVYYITKKIDKITDFAEATIDLNNEFFKEELKSSNETFYVVREDGTGFYHNLINMSKEWVVLILEKHLKQTRPLLIESIIKNYPSSEQQTIKNITEALSREGDYIFYKEPNLVNDVIHINVKRVLPVLINLLNIGETGKHEQCTVFAIILKIAKNDPRNSLPIIARSLQDRAAPGYYLEELTEKIKKYNYQ